MVGKFFVSLAIDNTVQVDEQRVRILRFCVKTSLQRMTRCRFTESRAYTVERARVFNAVLQYSTV